jgi:hypothetical protein
MIANRRYHVAAAIIFFLIYASWLLSSFSTI